MKGSGFRGQGSSSFAKATEDQGFRGAAWIVLLVLMAGCAAPTAQMADAEWVSHSTTGRGAYERGDFRRSADAYARAQQRARALDHADALAVAAANRAVALLAAGRAAEAQGAVEEALADARVSSRRQAELRVVAARAALAQQRTDHALALAAAALAPNPAPAVRAQALLVQSAAWLAQGEPGPAAQALADGLAETSWARLAPALRAERLQRLGQVAAAEGRLAEAVVRGDAAVLLWLEAGRLPEMARTLAEAGRQARLANDAPGAGDRLYRAARSLWAQGLGDEAARVLEEGVACAAEAADEVLGRRLAELLVTFQGGRRLEE